jgi:hypothetical protein
MPAAFPPLPTAFRLPASNPPHPLCGWKRPSRAHSTRFSPPVASAMGWRKPLDRFSSHPTSTAARLPPAAVPKCSSVWQTEEWDRPRLAQHSNNCKTAEPDQPQSGNPSAKRCNQPDSGQQPHNSLRRPADNAVSRRGVTVTCRGTPLLPTLTPISLKALGFGPDRQRAIIKATVQSHGGRGIRVRFLMNRTTLGSRRASGPAPWRNVAFGRNVQVFRQLDRSMGWVGQDRSPAAIIDLVRIFRGPFQKTCCPSATGARP